MEVKDSTGEMRDRMKVNESRPKITDFKGRKGFRYRDEIQPDGSIVPVVSYTPNVDGVPTKQAKEVQEAMTPFIRSDVERRSNLPQVERIALRDQAGNVRLLKPALADQKARQNGWSHVWRPGGIRVESGLSGKMLWRPLGDTWEPTGRTQVGYDGEECDKATVQVDPDGNEWRYLDGAWRMTEEQCSGA